MASSEGKESFDVVSCSQHHLQTLTSLCSDCITALCPECKPQHSQHRIIETDIDTHKLRKACMQKVSSLMDVLHELENIPNGAANKIEVYEQAKELVKRWRHNILKIVNEDAGRLLNVIQDQIDKHEKVKSEVSSYVKFFKTRGDKQISKMSETRKISNHSMLLNHISESDQIINDVTTLLATVENNEKKRSLNEILPFKDKLSTLERDLHDQFSTRLSYCDLHDQFSTRSPSYCDLQQVKSTATGNRNMEICQSYKDNPEKVVMYTYDGYTVSILDTKTYKTTDFKCEKNIHTMVQVSDDRYVMSECDSYDIHVLDRSFKVIKTVPNDDNDNYRAMGLCVKDEHVFIVWEFGNSNKSRCREGVLNDTTLNLRTLCEIVASCYCGFMSLHTDKQRIIVADGKRSLCTIQLTTGGYQKVDMTGLGGLIRSLHISRDDRILVGNRSGHVYMKNSDAWEKIIDDIGDEVWGITVRGPCVTLTCPGGSMVEYK